MEFGISRTSQAGMLATLRYVENLVYNLNVELRIAGNV